MISEFSPFVKENPEKNVRFFQKFVYYYRCTVLNTKKPPEEGLLKAFSDGFDFWFFVR